MRVKQLHIASLLVLGLLSFAGCSGGDGSKASSPADTTDTEQRDNAGPSGGSGNEGGLKPTHAAAVARLTEAGGTVRETGRGSAHQTHVIFTGVAFDQRALKHLPGLSDVTILRLDALKMSNESMVHLKGLDRLRELKLDGSEVTGAGLANIANLRTLQTLSLVKLKLMDPDLRHLAGLTGLKLLNLNNTALTGSSIAVLRDIPGLELRLSGAFIMNQHMSQFSELKNVQLLDLSYTHISDEGLVHLAGLKQLKELYLVRLLAITDAGLESLKGLSGLRSLSIQGTRVTAAGVARLRSSLPNCKILGNP